jgi:hypothetical protein
VAFLLLFAAMPMLMTAFGRMLDAGYDSISGVLSGLARGGP